MLRKIILGSAALLSLLILSLWGWWRYNHNADPQTTQEIQALILQSLEIDAQAAYSLDSSLLAEVYTNDPRGSDLTAYELGLIQEMYPGSGTPTDPPGYLDYKQALIERSKRDYALLLADLHTKQAAGKLDPDEQAVLINEMIRLGTPTPTVIPVPPVLITPGLKLPRSNMVAPYPSPVSDPNVTMVPSAAADQTLTQIAAYPGPARTPSGSPPGGNPSWSGPGPTADPPWLASLYRGPNPDSLPPGRFDFAIQSIRVKNDLARVVISQNQNSLITEIILVKAAGQWRIAGSRVLKAPCCG